MIPLGFGSNNPGFYFPELIASDVTVTNMRGVYSDDISGHIMYYIVAFARSRHVYVPQQLRGEWRSEGEGGPAIHLPETTALIIGVGGIGGSAAAAGSGLDATTKESPRRRGGAAAAGEQAREGPAAREEPEGAGVFVVADADREPNFKR